MSSEVTEYKNYILTRKTRGYEVTRPDGTKIVVEGSEFAGFTAKYSNLDVAVVAVNKDIARGGRQYFDSSNS